MKFFGGSPGLNLKARGMGTFLRASERTSGLSDEERMDHDTSKLQGTNEL